MKTPITHAAAAALTIALAASGQVLGQQQGMQTQPQGPGSAQMGGQAGTQSGGQAQGGSQMQGSTQGQPQTAGGADVRVKEAPAKIQVQQEEPDVTVRQPAPDVTITQPDPKVQIRQPEPSVSVQEARPEVQVTSPGQPEVRIIQTEEPTVRYQRVETEQQAGTQQGQTMMQGRAQQQLMSKTANDLEGMNVQSQQGENIGSVDKVVKEHSTNKLHAVLSVGGVLGIGAEKIAIGLDQLSMQGEDQLVAPISGNEEGLAQRYSYDENRFTELEQKDIQLSQAAGGGSGQIPSFQQLDRDQDGFLTQQDVQQYDQLSNQWQQIDRNSDQRIDRSEFSAFEQQSQQQGGTQMGQPHSGAQGGAQMRQPQGGAQGGGQMR